MLPCAEGTEQLFPCLSSRQQFPLPCLLCCRRLWTLSLHIGALTLKSFLSLSCFQEVTCLFIMPCIFCVCLRGIHTQLCNCSFCSGKLWEMRVSVGVLPLKVVEHDKGKWFLNKLVTLKSVSFKEMEIEENRAERGKPPPCLGLLAIMLSLMWYSVLGLVIYEQCFLVPQKNCCILYMCAFVIFSLAFGGVSPRSLVNCLAFQQLREHVLFGLSPLCPHLYHVIRADLLKSPGWESWLEKKLWWFRVREVINFFLLQKCLSIIENYVILQ